MNDLAIPLDPEGDHLHRQIYEYLKNAIKGGELVCGDRLPSTRILASFHGISRSTAILAYDQLLSEGYIESRPGSGYYVCSVEELYDIPHGEKEETLERESEAETDIRIDFSPNMTDSVRFPFNVWRRLYREALKEENRELFSAGDPKGDPELRGAICRYLRASRKVNARPEQVIIGAGNDYLLMLIIRMLGPGKRVAMEDPSYKRAARIFRGGGYEVVPIPIYEDTDGKNPGIFSGEGMDRDSLLGTGVDIAYVMPSRQFPTGISMPIGRQLSLISWACEAPGRYLIEDDYDSEFRYRGSPLPSLQASDSGGRVIYMGTFSKAIAPAVRISYMVIPRELEPAFDATCGMLSTTVSRLDQRIMCNFINEGHFERHLNRMRSLYRQRQEFLISTIKSAIPGACIEGEGAGLHVSVFLKGVEDYGDLAKECRSRGVKVYPMELYGIADKKITGLILGYAALSESDITEGIRILSDVVNIAVIASRNEPTDQISS